MAITRVGGSWIHKYVSLVADDVTHTYTRAAKPELNLPNGSRCFEMDSDIEYIYDRENDAWEVYVPSSGGSPTGTTDYTQLTNKPSINNVQLSGNKSLNDFGIASSNDVSALSTAITNMEPKVDNAASAIINTVSGDIASFDDGADDMPIKHLIANIEPVQDLHGYDAPWPAGGGKNLYNKDNTAGQTNGAYLNNTGSEVSNSSWFITDYIPVKGTTFTVSKVGGTSPAICLYDSNKSFLTGVAYNTLSATVLANVTITSDTEAAYARFSINTSQDTSIIQLEAGSTATAWTPYSNDCPISRWTGLTGARVGKNLVDISQFATVYSDRCTYADGVLSFSSMTPAMYTTGILTRVPSGATLSWQITIGTAENFKVRFRYADGTTQNIPAATTTFVAPKEITAVCIDYTASGTATLSNFMASIVASDYEPYQGQTISVSWTTTEAGTVYGCTLDVITGKLTVTYAKDSKTWGSLTTIETLTATIRKRFDYFSAASVMSGIRETAICNIAPYNSSSSLDDTHFYTMNAKVAAQIFLPVNTPDSTVIEICYPLDTPIVYQLDPVTVNTLLGNNTVYVDCGSVTVDYLADTKTYVDNNERGAVEDVQINGTSILSNGVANIPNASTDAPGVVRINADRGITLYGTNSLQINAATSGQVKNGGTGMLPLTPYHQHESTFYGLAKAAGDTTMPNSSNEVGTYTEAAKTAIRAMLGVTDYAGGMNVITLTGTNITQTAAENTMYKCGELAELTFTAPASGITAVRFSSGSTPTVASFPGVTWLGDFDPDDLLSNVTYEINIFDGVGVAGWA